MKRNFTYIILSITLSLFFALPTFGQDYAYSWLSQLKGSSDLYVQDVETDAGFVYVTGYFTGTVDFNPTGTANTLTAVGTDGFIARYSKDNGALSYAKIITSASTVQVWDIEINGTYMYVTGNFAGTTDFNTHPSGTYNLTSYGTTPGSSTDAFIVRYRASDCAIYWAKQIGGTSSDYAKGIAVDASDNIYVTGYFYGTADFDPTTALQERTSAGGSDIFYAKYNSSGAYQWAQGAGDTGYQYAEDIELAGSYIYLSGYYAGTTSFYAGLNCSFICLPTYKSVTSLGGYDGFVAKISTGGLASSAFSIGGTSNDYIFDLALDAGSNIFIAGYHYGTTDFNPSTSTYNQTSSGYTDAFVAKYSNTGTFSWVKRVYGAGYNYAYKVEIDNSNYVNVAGVFSNTAYFYSGSYSSIGSGYDGYLLKLNNSGTYLKHFAVGGSGTDNGKALSTDGQDIYLGGYFASTDGDFDPWTTTDGNFSRQASYDGYIARYTALDAQPSSIPTNMTFSNITTSQIQVSYTAATGPPDGYLIVGRKNYWPATAPVDGRTYTAGSTLGQSVVVYSGAATTGTMTGLDPAGVYAFKVYAYNGSGFTTNYTTSSLSAYEYTLATEPTASPSTPTFANVNSTSFDLSFSAAAGPPTGYLVLRAEGAWPDTAPTDKEYYTVGQGLGNAVVANIGSSNSSLAQSGLTPGSDYYFKIYSYNGNSSTINYRTTSPLTATQNTLVSEPDAQATGISFSGAASNSIGTINFSTASGSPDGYIVVRKASGAAAWQPADGNTYTLNSTQGDGVIVHVGAGASFSDSYSMLANTEYFYTVYSYNGSGVYTNYYLNTPLTGSVFTLSTEPGAQPTVLNLSLAAPPDNISVINGSFTAASGPPTGYIVLRNVDAYPTSLPVDGTEYLAGESFGDATVAYVGTGTSFSNIDLAEATNYRYRVYSYNSNVASSTTINYKTDVPLEDNLSTEGSIVAPTAAPTSMVFSDVTSSSLTVSFTDASPTPGGYIAIRGAGFDPTSAPQDGTVYTNEVLASGTVAYVGSATTFVDDALAAGTEYTYRIYSYNGSGAGILYFTGTGNYLANSKTTFAIEPATQPTSLNFSTDPVLTDFLGLSFTETTPSSYLILRKTGGYPVDQPVDGEAYTGDADVFYTQSGLSKNETGLVPGTNYFYVIYAYSGSGVTLNYNTTAPLQGNHYLLAVEPDGQPSALAFSNTTTLGFDVNYSLATGVPDGYLGIIKENSAPTGVPADGTSYSAGAPIGDGTVVFSSNVKPVTLSGGSPGVEYFLHIYSYNGSGGGTKYRTTDLPLSGSHFTFATEPTEPAVVGAFTDITATTMTLNLTHPSDKPDGYLVIRKEASPPGGTPVDGQEYIAGTDLIGGDPVIYVGTQEIVSIANDLLNDGSTYHYAIFSYNGSGQSINYLSASPATGSETTLPVTAPTAVAASLVFTNVTSNSLSIDFDSGTPLPEGYIVLRKAGMSTTTPSNFTTYTLGETVVDTEVAYVGDLSGVSVAFDDTGLTPDNTYYYYVFAYNGESTATKYNSTSQSGSVALFADEPLSQPSDLVFSGITSTTIDATFTKSDATNYLVIRSEGTSPTTLPVDGTTYTPGVILDASNATTVVSVGTGNVANATSLTLSTQYFYSVYAYNGTGASTNYLLDGALSGDAWTLAEEPATQ
ncbi:MAG: fibronectin type III domain-containing protein, partial [Cyclobacteriaceae bacterium]|nr:fibronectin type III domain-containing protein [Cyclobacteriaceae bacterium]